MELVTIALFILFLIAIPPTLFKIVGEQYASDLTISNAMIKVTLSFLVYAALSIFTLLFVFFMYVGPHPSPGHTTQFEEKLVGLIAVFVYGIVGWLLCSLVNGKLVKLWEVFRFKKERPQSIFDSQ